MTRCFFAFLLVVLWVCLSGCPPTAPVLPRQAPGKARKQAPTKVTKRGVKRRVAKRATARTTKRDPNLPPGVRYIMRGSKSKSRLPGKFRKYANSKRARVMAVYYEKNQKPHPLAKKLCHALHNMPKEKRKVCCKDKYMLFHPGGECVRTLTAALRSKRVSLLAKDVDKCVVALHKTYEGCEWIGFWPPRMPAACQGIFTGTLKKGAMCRSGLECKKGMYCHGLGTTVPGRCWTALPNKMRCGTGIDPLAVYTRQDNLAVIKPRCQGICVRTFCVSPKKLGQACISDSHCIKGLHCANKVCVKEAFAKLGQPCTSKCEGISRCLKSVCTMPKKTGSACATDDECRGGCLKQKGKKVGVCGIQCSLIRR